MAPRSPSAEEWHPVCRLSELQPRRGVAALVHGQAVAIFRTDRDEVHAVGNHDPFVRGSVLARGIVGTRGRVLYVAPVAHGRHFDLRTGRCLEDDQVSVPVYAVRVVAGVVLVGRRTEAAGLTGPGAPRRSRSRRRPRRGR